MHQKTHLLHWIQAHTSVVEPVITGVTGNHIVIRVVRVLTHAEEDGFGMLLAEEDKRAIILQF